MILKPGPVRQGSGGGEQAGCPSTPWGPGWAASVAPVTTVQRLWEQFHSWFMTTPLLPSEAGSAPRPRPFHPAVDPRGRGGFLLVPKGPFTDGPRRRWSWPAPPQTCSCDNARGWVSRRGAACASLCAGELGGVLSQRILQALSVLLTREGLADPIRAPGSCLYNRACRRPAGNHMCALDSPSTVSQDGSGSRG